MEAGYRWAKQVPSEPVSDEDRAEFPRGYVEQKESPFVINYDDWDAYQLFLMCFTQWRENYAGKRTGLDYAAVISLAKIMGMASSDTITGVRCLETGALAAYMGKTLEFLLDG